MLFIGILISMGIFYFYSWNRSKKYSTVLFISSAIIVVILSITCSYLGIFHKWWVELFGIPIATFIAVYISLCFRPYTPKEIEQNAYIKDYYNILKKGKSTLFDILQLDVPKSESDKSIKLLKNVLFAFSSSATITNILGNRLINESFFSYIDYCKDDIAPFIEFYIDDIFNDVIIENKMLQKVLIENPNTKRMVFNLTIPIIISYFKDKYAEDIDGYSDYHSSIKNKQL